MTEQHMVGLVVLAIFVGMILIEAAGGHHRSNTDSWKGRGYALAGIASHVLLAGPVVALVMGLLFNRLFPGTAGALGHVSFWIAFPIAFFIQEFGHYWVHRWAHEKRWLWKLHRTHHSAEKLNALVLYRYNIFWTLLLPQVWIGALAFHLGMYEVFAAVALIEFVVNALTHTPYRWDLALRRLPGMNPMFNVLEKVITLPDTHHAHHGLGRHAHARGNYAVCLFFLDVLYGTAKIPRERQERFGLPAKFDWKEELFWPLVRKAPRRPAAKQASARA
ncbi:MAG TPA: sterol desaturase family protein [Spongiibacteraceae bacterium]|jgi:sterol desaturase/sphingolipid hydroxylase (fatty acid hydroxylase superfamily)|nr:sterol desaturase family protein [Spongiibacteraceae bacterium]HUH39045.1 sterol desaturase family protein [Spongiibacteraceae bacterium]